ncbi:MAG: N-acetyltransferase [Rhodospirillaceae bacterium]|jgi:predicted N-acetyltransferase YhbS|nr:N-acetyltransferase [Rhodospirillaceae bacterium]MBT5240553.1 N-acetyltransferase [Rhodospirillaceae bacterium]MBT5564883.1 N-acetyltransferase [Rhodospirillaceae bacterium]MBT6089635.1 N-acetyltransferase [Rhodospirillaceae bacterium]MBT7449308.1 N-acetyltransferase [Rhodospirillaceae bacterium]
MTSPSTIVRPETEEDQTAIHALHATAFETSAEAGLVDLLRTAGALSLSLIAEQDGALVGHVAVSPVTINDSDEAQWYGLGPISVHPKHQGEGIGTALMLKALKETATIGGQGMVLLGKPAFYTRFGFQPSTELGLPWEKDVGPYFQAVKLGAADIPSGVVKYHAAFDAV